MAASRVNNPVQLGEVASTLCGATARKADRDVGDLSGCLPSHTVRTTAHNPEIKALIENSTTIML